MNIRRYFLTITTLFLIPFVVLAQAEVTPVYLKFRADKVHLLEAENVEIVADLYIGTWENPVQNFYAATIDLVFATDVLITDSTFFKYQTNSFLGQPEEISVVNKAPEALKSGHLNISVSRNDGKNVNGFGKIGEISFVINADIIGGRNSDEIPFNVKARYIKLLDVAGNQLPHETDEEGATIIIVNDILARNAGIRNAPQVEVFPNPASDQLYIQLRNVQGERLEMFNVAGQRVKSDRLQGNQLQISIKDLHPGLYTIKVYTKEGIITRKVLLQ